MVKMVVLVLRSSQCQGLVLVSRQGLLETKTKIRTKTEVMENLPYLLTHLLSCIHLSTAHVHRRKLHFTVTVFVVRVVFCYAYTIEMPDNANGFLLIVMGQWLMSINLYLCRLNEYSQ